MDHASQLGVTQVFVLFQWRLRLIVPGSGLHRRLCLRGFVVYVVDSAFKLALATFYPVL